MLQEYFSLKGFIRESEQSKVFTSKPHRGKIFIKALICLLYPNYEKEIREYYVIWKASYICMSIFRIQLQKKGDIWEDWELDVYILVFLIDY